MHLQIFTTGGTIDKIYFDAKSDYQIGEPQIAEILKTAGVTFAYAVTPLLHKDSLELTDADRAVIVQHVLTADAAHVVITHGTDTMVETAQAIAAALDAEAVTKTVVLVGSLTPARFKHSDAEFNIGFAVAAAQTLPAGVYLAMNGRVFEPQGVRKNRALNRFEAL